MRPSRKRIFLALAPSLLAGCATTRFTNRAESTEVLRAALVRTAEDFIGRRQTDWKGQHFTNDCVGFVRLVYAANGIDLYALGSRGGENGVAVIYGFAQLHGTIHRDAPRPGDLVFFHDTYDRNGDGVPNDGLTHVGVVQAVYPDGTVEVIHRVRRGVVRYRMNADHPLDRTRDGRVINDYLRRDRDGHSVTAGTLFASYATVVR
jgi:hypothetical protein